MLMENFLFSSQKVAFFIKKVQFASNYCFESKSIRIKVDAKNLIRPHFCCHPTLLNEEC